MKLFRRSRRLARRYGHASIAEVDKAAAGLRKLASDNAPVVAGLLGAAAGALGGTLGAGTGALVGGVGGVLIEEVAKKK